ncbi:unnamed protein product [Clonostachys chloroleuca]|uniref:Major facilitator superfamily (MFS) profile domain-containing protein n=1 Tax=Clonostachys chloroleuca TaxID=1926264 RepID=A0AA35M4U0_9HYPO|nr:unnamed protein product [Clonostachys chloroleuca]
MAAGNTAAKVGSVHEKQVQDIESSSTARKEPDDDIPDGGAAAWLVVFGTWCTSFCSFGWINSVGIFQDYYQHELLSSFSSSTIAWIPSLQIFFMFASGPLIGKLYDRYGPHYLIFGGTLLHVFGLMMASISKEYYQILLSQGVCSAIGASAIFQPAISSVRDWFSKKRAAAFGICSTGSSLGGVIFPIMLSRLIRQVGYGWTMRISAFLILGLLVIANLTVRQRVKHRPAPVGHKANYTAPFKELPMLFLMIGFFLITFGVFVPIDYIVVEANAFGMGTNIRQYIVPILNAASFFGRTSCGLVADKVGHFNVFTTVCATTSILILGLWIPASSNAAIICFAAFFGFFSGAYVSLLPALVAEVSPPEEFGYRTGLLFGCASIGGLVTNPIAGAIIQLEHGSFRGLKIFAGTMYLAGTMAAFGARLIKTDFRLGVKF